MPTETKTPACAGAAEMTSIDTAIDAAEIRLRNLEQKDMFVPS
jgi:hypothetical protein